MSSFESICLPVYLCSDTVYLRTKMEGTTTITIMMMMFHELRRKSMMMRLYVLFYVCK